MLGPSRVRGTEAKADTDSIAISFLEEQCVISFYSFSEKCSGKKDLRMRSR